MRISVLNTKVAGSRAVRALACALALGVSATAAMAGKADNSLIIGAPIDFSQPDAAYGALGTDLQFLYTMHDRLIGFDPKDMSLVPMLATEWSWSDDKRTLTLKLREGVKFHDGTEFNAEAVKTSLQYFKDVKVNRDINDVTDIAVVDPLTIAITTEKPNASLLGNLAERAGMIISPKSIADNKPGELGFNTAGTGPFRIAAHEPGNFVRFERFPDYWDKESKFVDKIEYRIIKNSTSIITALMSGQLDYASPLDPINMEALKRNPNLRIEVEPTLAFGLINVNTGLKPTDDKRVRQAMMYAMDREALARAVYGENVETGAALQPVPESYWPYTESLKGAYSYDIDKAKALLAEAGYADGLKASFCINASYGMPAPAIKISDILREQMKPAGIEFDLVSAASNSVCAQRFNVDATLNMFLASWSGRVDPVITYALMVGSNSFYNASKTKYQNADEIIAELQQTFEKEQQKPLFHKLNAIWIEELPMFPLYYFANVVAYNAELKGGEPNLLGRPYVRTLHYDN